MQYFSDRELGPKPRNLEEITPDVWGGIFALIDQRTDDGSFGYGCPRQCRDGDGVIGCDFQKLGLKVKAVIPNLEWPLSQYNIPLIFQILDRTH